MSIRKEVLHAGMLWVNNCYFQAHDLASYVWVIYSELYNVTLYLIFFFFGLERGRTREDWVCTACQPLAL